MSEQIILGWREWLRLPELGDFAIKAKIDTGAKTSALHAFFVTPYESEAGEQWVHFGLHPDQDNIERVVECRARVKDQRIVSDSGGHRENRYVIETPLVIGGQTFVTELTLTDRDSMKFRMLLGRSALKEGFLVDSALSYQLGKPKRKKKVSQ